MSASLPPSAAERLLLDEIARALRAPAGRLALALHVSRLKPPAPKPHHARIARALLEDAALRHGGQVFPLRNGDVMLLAGAGDGGGNAPAGLPAAFARLFGADAPEPALLCSLWQLPADAGALTDWVMRRLGDATPPQAAPEPDIGPAMPVAAIEGLIAHMALETALTQQTAVRVAGPAQGAALPLSARLTPLHTELSLSLAGAAGAPGLRDALADPFLFRYFAARLDLRILALLRQDFEQHGRLSRLAARNHLPLHVNLTLDAVLSPAFGAAVEAASRRGARLGVEIPLIEAACDPARLAQARAVLRQAHIPFVLDAIDHLALLLTHPGGLQPDLVKLHWSARLAEPQQGAVAQAVQAAVARIGPARVVLHRTESEAALAWGQAHGITQFQGLFMDALQAAGRIAICHSARPCTLRLCIERAAAHAPSQRSGCGNPALLDMSAAIPAMAAPASGSVGQAGAPQAALQDAAP